MQQDDGSRVLRKLGLSQAGQQAVGIRPRIRQVKVCAFCRTGLYAAQEHPSGKDGLTAERLGRRQNRGSFNTRLGVAAIIDIIVFVDELFEFIEFLFRD